MKSCTFFGHKDAPREIEDVLYQVMNDLVVHHGVDVFYVGNQGNFDAMTLKSLRRLRKQYPHIRYAVVLACMPLTVAEYEKGETVFPEGLERVPPRYAIDRRNRWMINSADYVITYVKRSIGGAVKFKNMAERCGKTVVEIAEKT